MMSGKQIDIRTFVTVEVKRPDYEGQNSRIYATGNSLDLYDRTLISTLLPNPRCLLWYNLQDYKCYRVDWRWRCSTLMGSGSDVTVYRKQRIQYIVFSALVRAGWTDTQKR